jgi:hypothetical protein
MLLPEQFVHWLKLSFQNAAIQIFIFFESLIKCNHLISRSAGKGGEVCVVPYFWRERLMLRILPPVRFHSCRFGGVQDTWIVSKSVIHSPRISQGYSLIRQCFRVRGNAQKSLLSHATKEATTVGKPVEPIFGSWMMQMSWNAEAIQTLISGRNIFLIQDFCDTLVC